VETGSWLLEAGDAFGGSGDVDGNLPAQMKSGKRPPVPSIGSAGAVLLNLNLSFDLDLKGDIYATAHP
jgi:hypothetical protein